MPAPVKQPVSKPLSLNVPPNGVVFAESVHAPEFSMRNRSDPFFKLIFVLNGRIRITSDGSPHRELSKGLFFPIPSQTPHSIVDLAPSTLLLLCIGDSFIKNDPLRLEVWERLVRNFQRGAMPSGLVAQEISSTWRLAILEQLGVRFGHALSTRTAATQILLSLARMPLEPNDTAANTSKRRIQSLIERLEKSFFEHWDLDKAALATRLSKKQFTKLFKEATGATFLQRLTQLRMQHAATLLLQSEQSVLTIAFSCGYQDLSHFYRLFKQAHGSAPIQWRETAMTRIANQNHPLSQ